MLFYMSTYNAPDFVVDIYNPAFFASDTTTSLTQAQASALFLSKSTADTATALTSFTAGIATNSIAPTASATAMTISSSANTGSITIDTGKTGTTNADPALAIGTSNVAKVIKIGNSNANNSVHIGTLDIAGSSLNTTAGTTGTISIGNLQSTGTIDIGNLTTRTGAITIGSSSTNTVPITIGSTSAGSTTTIRNPVTTFSYTTTPTYTGIGQTVYTVLNTLGQDPITLATDTIAIGVSLPIGVYYISYSLRICAASTSVTSTVTALQTYLILTGQTAATGVPNVYGESSQLYSQTAPTVSTALSSPAPTVNGSTVLRVTVAGILNLRYVISASSALVFFNNGAATRIPYNYLAYCRIG